MPLLVAIHRCSLRSFLILLVCSLAVGCGGSGDQPEVAEVTGTVTLDGQPLHHAILKFQPTSGRPSMGTTDENGVYRLHYLHNVEGAKIGEHKVSISTEDFIEDMETGKSEFHPEILGPQYNTQTTLTASVVEGDNSINFDLVSDPRNKPGQSEVEKEMARDAK